MNEDYKLVITSEPMWTNLAAVPEEITYNGVSYKRVFEEHQDINRYYPPEDAV